MKNKESKVSSKLISDNEWKIIQDLRGLKFGHLTVTKQDSVIIDKEITKKEKVQKVLDNGS